MKKLFFITLAILYTNVSNFAMATDMQNYKTQWDQKNEESRNEYEKRKQKLAMLYSQASDCPVVETLSCEDLNKIELAIDCAKSQLAGAVYEGSQDIFSSKLDKLMFVNGFYGFCTKF